MSFTVQDLVAMRRVEGIAAAPDGSWHAVEVHTVDAESGKYHPSLWRIGSDGTVAPLLEGNCSYTNPCFRPDGRLGFCTNRPLDARDAEPEEAPGDDVRTQVWLLDDDGPRPLTDEPLGVSSFAFARSGDGLFVMTSVLPGVPHEAQRETVDDRRKRGPSALHYTDGRIRYWDHWVPASAPHLIAYDSEGEHRRDLTPEAHHEHRTASWDVAPDGSKVVITAMRTNRFGLDDFRLLVIDVASGESVAIYDKPEELGVMPRFSNDGERIAFSQQTWTKGKCPRERLFVVNVDGSGLTELAADFERWLRPATWTDEDHLVVTADDEAHGRVFTIDPTTGTPIPLPFPPGAGYADDITTSGGGLVGIAHGLQHPPEVFRIAEDGTASWMTELTTPAATFEALADVTSATVAGAGGDPVQYWILTPKHVHGPAPTLLWIHGGPIGAWNQQWHWRWNANVMLAAGYTVVLPNPRGSTGFGQAFIDGIWNNEWGGACYDDLMAVVDAVATHPAVDPDRLIAMGGSFGGYMTNYLGGKTDRFACLVTHASLYDLPQFASTTDHPPFWRFQSGASRWDDLDAVNRHSPHMAVSNWKTPTLVIHGERDYRVPVSEALSLYDALQYHGVESELLIFPDENHWILKPSNIEAWYGHVIEFIGRYTAKPS